MAKNYSWFTIVLLLFSVFALAAFAFLVVEYRAYHSIPYEGTTIVVDQDGSSEYVPPKSFFQWLISADKTSRLPY